MKKIILMLLIAFISAGCNNPNTEEPPIEEIPNLDFNLSDEEVYELAMRRANELQVLYSDFLIAGAFLEERLAFSYDKNNKVLGIFVTEEGRELTREFFIVIHDEIKTYDDLYSLFGKTFTPQFGKDILRYFTHFYTDIDGQLAFLPDDITGGNPEDSSAGSQFVSFEVVDERIKLNFSVIIDLFLDEVLEEGRYVDYSIILENIDDEWLIDEGTDIRTHGYYWR
jgi:hypothetical protein